jgi:hypothetical protein
MRFVGATRMPKHRWIVLLFVFLTVAGGGAALAQQNAPALIRLPKQASSPVMGYRAGKFAPMGREASLAGWLVLNGASFPNEEYPVLAKQLREVYAREGFVVNDRDSTPLQNHGVTMNAKGEVVSGLAICPSPALCGDLTGTFAPFNLNSDL